MIVIRSNRSFPQALPLTSLLTLVAALTLGCATAPQAVPAPNGGTAYVVRCMDRTGCYEQAEKQCQEFNGGRFHVIDTGTKVSGGANFIMSTQSMTFQCGGTKPALGRAKTKATTTAKKKSRKVADGRKGGACYGNGTCNEALSCIAKKCRRACSEELDCPQFATCSAKGYCRRSKTGALKGKCYDNDTCNEGLLCRSKQCVAPAPAAPEEDAPPRTIAE